MKERKQTIQEIVWYLLILIFAFVWFTQVHPLVIFDADDWTYLMPDREAWPILGEWNPAKVLPEIFMPLCSTVGNLLLMPLLKDYVTVMTVTHAYVVSAFIVIYVSCVARLLKRLFQLDTWGEIYAGALLLVFHFLALRSQESGNLYLFYCKDVNCYYNYLIPGLLNGCIVLWMMKNPQFDYFMSTGSHGAKGIFLLVLYLAIFSNLTDSVILAVYAGAKLLADSVYILSQEKKLTVRTFLKDRVLLVGILGTWLVSALFELSGDRAGTAASGSLVKRLGDTAYGLLQVLKSCNVLFVLLCAAIVVGALVLYLHSKGRDSGFRDLCTLWIICILVMTCCMVVLCAVVEPDYIYRAEYLFPIFFCCLMLVMLCFGYVIQQSPKLLLLLPILLCVLISETDTREKTFQESNIGNVDSSICADISRDLIGQVTAACEAGESEMTLYVPVWDSDDNWPHALQLMERIGYTLYTHRVIDYPIPITVEASEEKNVQFNLPIPAPAY